MNALLNIGLLIAASLHGVTLAKVAWAFAASNILTGICYQIAVERLVWRREPRLLEAQA
jgi:hypothetical protein